MRIVVAMSGGVDSSVAAALLAEQGHDVIGLSMQLYDQTEGQTAFGGCCSLDDLYDARKVAAAIRIPHYILNFERQFHEQRGKVVSVTRHSANPLRSHADMSLLVSAHDDRTHIQPLLYAAVLQHLLDLVFVMLCEEGDDRLEHLNASFKRAQRFNEP